MIHFGVRPRLTLRMLMILIAIFGLFFGGCFRAAKMWARYREAEREASHHARESIRWSDLIRDSKGIAAPVSVTRTPITGLWRQHLEKNGYDTTQPYFYQLFRDRNKRYNFRWPVRTLKAGDGAAQTPAMLAKLADHVWTLLEWIKRPAVQFA